MKNNKHKVMKISELFPKRIMISALLLSVILFVSTTAFSQITITTNDMPSPGDTVRKSNALTTGNVDYTLTGENYNWDFTGLFPLFQTVDEYENVSSVPFLYQLVFIPTFVANLAQKFPEADTLGLPISDPYRFFKNTSSSFTDVGFAVTVSDIPIPLKFNNADVVYDFPVNYGNADSSFSGVDFGIPDLGFIGIDRKRVNKVDGWGTLTTSYGSFDVLRLKSTVEEYDSIYIDSLNFGTGINRLYTEYKWMANGFSSPLLQITEEGALLTVAWTDSVFDPTTTIGEPLAQQQTFSIVPNPISGNGTIHFQIHESGLIYITIYDLTGVAVSHLFEGEMEKGSHEISVSGEHAQLKNGIYFVRLQTHAGISTQKLIVQ
ncbi:MAG: T9SS type A sorting domain-containing protein [Bacteroidales bacterium]|nr:T9SS type A sorting domain-containing protein [Bacteroidales bacterium]